MQTALHLPRLVSLPHISCRNERVDIDGSCTPYCHVDSAIVRLDCFWKDSLLYPHLAAQRGLAGCSSVVDEDPQQSPLGHIIVTAWGILNPMV